MSATYYTGIDFILRNPLARFYTDLYNGASPATQFLFKASEEEYMTDWKLIQDMDYRIKIANTHSPKDIFTIGARLLITVLNFALLILLPIQLITTGLGGCLIALSFGAVFFVLDLIWWPFLLLLLSTSWLWLFAWYLRPILLVPGVIISIIAHVYVMLTPDPEKDAKYSKLSISNEWPLSWYLLKPPSSEYQPA